MKNIIIFLTALTFFPQIASALECRTYRVELDRRPEGKVLVRGKLEFTEVKKVKGKTLTQNYALVALEFARPQGGAISKYSFINIGTEDTLTRDTGDRKKVKLNLLNKRYSATVKIELIEPTYNKVEIVFFEKVNGKYNVVGRVDSSFWECRD